MATKATTKETPIPTQTQHLYGGAVRCDFYEKLGRKKHVYQLDGVEVPSVTRVLSVLDKLVFIAWALNEMESALLTSWQPGRQYDELEIRELLRKAKGAKDEISSTAKDVGSVAHDWIEQYIKAKMSGEASPELPFSPAIKAACEAFLSWESSNHVVWLESERRIASKQHGFAGTMDFEAIFNGDRVIGDIKTSKGIWPEYWLQTAAYQIGREEERRETDGHYAEDLGNRTRMSSQYDKRIILRLGKNPDAYGVEFEVQERRDFETDCQLFLAALQLQKGMQLLNSFKGDGNGSN